MTIEHFAIDLHAALAEEGYCHFHDRDGVLCAILPFAFTTGLVVGLDVSGYERRYCYETEADARGALEDWDGVGHPSGPWIKCKGVGIDMLNPDFFNKKAA